MGSGEGLVRSTLLLKWQTNMCVRVFNRTLDLGLILSKSIYSCHPDMNKVLYHVTHNYLDDKIPPFKRQVG